MNSDRLIAVAGSVVVHLVLLGILAFTLWERPEPPKMAAHKPIIQATAVDEATAMAPVRRREAEEQRKREEAERQRQTAEAKKQRQAEEQRKKAEAEMKRQAELKRKKAEAERQRKQAELKRKEEEKRKKAEAEKQRLAEEKRKKAEAEQKRLAEEQRKKEEAESKLKAAMAAEQERFAAEARAQSAQQRAREMNQYIAAIQSAVQRQWQRPPGSSSDFVCKVLVKQIPSGDVVDVRVVESCGNMLLDRSVEMAVRKASPLPLPTSWDPDYRELEITFVPK